MKMNKKDFDALCEAIEGAMEKHSLPVIIKCRQNINKDQFVRFAGICSRQQIRRQRPL